MSPKQKYLEMNNTFVHLRDAIFNSDCTGEKEESPFWEKGVMSALSIIVSYLDYYKELNEIKTKEKESLINVCKEKSWISSSNYEEGYITGTKEKETKEKETKEKETKENDI